jgi:LytS/YehU family sensor histidine kinase
LHTVVQLIPRQPQRAAQAAEQLAGLLRTTLETERDIVRLGDEWAFVERYLDLERIRYAERLVVRADLPAVTLDATLPSFALQTLVENAVRHAAMPRVEPTEVAVAARLENGALQVRVTDTGDGADASTLAASPGTGLRRLRERLAALYGDRARLEVGNGDRGFTATLVVPQTNAKSADTEADA